MKPVIFVIFWLWYDSLWMTFVVCDFCLACDHMNTLSSNDLVLTNWTLCDQMIILWPNNQVCHQMNNFVTKLSWFVTKWTLCHQTIYLVTKWTFCDQVTILWPNDHSVTKWSSLVASLIDLLWATHKLFQIQHHQAWIYIRYLFM